MSWPLSSPREVVASRVKVAGRPILVTGSHRSGSTWVGQILATSRHVRYVHEPFHLKKFPCSCGVPFKHWYQYVCPENAGLFRAHFDQVLCPRLAGNHVRTGDGVDLLSRAKREFQILNDHFASPRRLIKDPMAFFSCEWLASEYDADVVVLIRHPAAFASSLRLKNWQFDFRHFADQPLLVRDHLEPFASDIKKFVDHPADLLDQAILLWRIINSVVLRYREAKPAWLFLRHEDLARDPVARFGDLFRSLSLDYSSHSQREIRSSSDASNPREAPGNVVHWLKRDSKALSTAWRQRLSPDEIHRVRAGVEDVATHFYEDGDW